MEPRLAKTAHSASSGKATAERTVEIVLKCDSTGSLEAVRDALSKIIGHEKTDISIIHDGVGAVNKSDILMAETGSRLIIGFQVDVLPGMEHALKEHRVEVRLYEVIYALTADMKALVESMVPSAPKEQVIGSAKVIALFKSTRKGIIIGCEILEGFLSVGHHFRIISVVGPVYIGTIESIHIGKEAIQKATSGKQVGIKIKDFNKAKIGDLVESFRPSLEKGKRWEPSGDIIRK